LRVGVSIVPSPFGSIALSGGALVVLARGIGSGSKYLNPGPRL
jgi:hypothetical protein